MSKTYKLTIMAAVVLAIAAVMLITNPGIFTPAENERDDVADLADNGEPAGVPGRAEAEFAPAADPYESYMEARGADKPVVLKFYARW